MPTYRTPGIYVEEVSRGPRPIEGVGMATAGFLGITPRADAHRDEVVAINNWMQFLREFSAEGAKSTPLAQGVYGFFENGGKRCFVLNVGPNGSIAGSVSQGRRRGIAAFEEIDEIAIVAAPGYTDPASYDALLSHCEKMRYRVAILDAPEEVPSIEALLKVATAEKGGKGPPEPGGGSPGVLARTSNYGMYYFPWITTPDPMEPTTLINVPPSGHVAGIYARTDTLRGVHKAPANEPVRGALNVTYRVTDEEQGELNQRGINCIRYFSTEGIRVWGARTLGDPEWRYVNVRRLFCMVEASIARSTRWVVFEPNNQTLWESMKRDVNAFLRRLWRDGALMGRTPEEAFFVKCDAETNPPEVVDAGTVMMMIGIAPVKPAEFIVFRIGQHAGGVEIETEGAANA